MKRGSGIKDRDERSKGIEILIADVFTKIKPTEPFRLTKQTDRRNRNWYDSSGSALARADVSRWGYKKNKRMKSSYSTCPRLPWIQKTYSLDHHQDQEYGDYGLNALCVWDGFFLFLSHPIKKRRRPGEICHVLKLWWVRRPIRLKGDYTSCAT